MPTREAINEHRAKRGAPELSEEEFQAIMRPPATPAAEPPSGASIAIKLGLIDPAELKEPDEAPKKASRKKK